MFEGLVNLGFNVFFGYIGLAFIVIVALFVLGGLFSIFSLPDSTHSTSPKPKVKEKSIWQLEIEKIKTKPLSVLKDMAIAGAVVLGASLLLGLVAPMLGL